MVTRRRFIAGLGASLAAAKFAINPFTFFENPSLPSSVSQASATVLYAVRDYEAGGEYRLWDKTPQQHCALYNSRRSITWRECLAFRGDPLADWGLTEDDDLDEVIGDDEVFYEFWTLHIDPHWGPRDMIVGLRKDLGVELMGDETTTGYIGFSYGLDYADAHVSDEQGLRLLQRRLNELGTGIRIEIAEEVDPYAYV